MAAARESLDHVQDGFVRAWVNGLETAATPTAALPFQHPEDDALWCNLDHNLEMARLHVVETVYRRFPSYTVEKLATAMGRGHSWLYAFLSRHRQTPWVQEILAR